MSTPHGAIQVQTMFYRHLCQTPPLLLRNSSWGGHSNQKCKVSNFNSAFFDTAPSFEAWETHRYLKNRLGIVRAQGGDLLDHPINPAYCMTILVGPGVSLYPLHEDTGHP